MNKIHKYSFALVGLCLLMPSFSHAANRVWQSDGSNENWSFASNWGGTAPTSADKAFFLNVDGADTSVVNVGYTVNGVKFQTTQTGLTSGYTINGPGVLTIDVAASSGYVSAIEIFGNAASARTNTFNANVVINNSVSGGVAAIRSGISSNQVGSALVFNGSLTAQTITNFSGVASTTTFLNGDLVNNSQFRFASDGLVVVDGIGTASGTGNLNFYNGVVELNRTSALFGNAIFWNGSDVTLNASDAFVGEARFIVQTAGSTLRSAGAGMEAGTLTLLADFTIDFMNQGGVMEFEDSSSIVWTSGATLNIINYGPSDSALRFGTDENGLTETQLAMITINGMSGATLDGDGYIVVPEPASICLLLMLLPGMVLLHRRRLKNQH